MRDDLPDVSPAGHRSVPPVVASLAVDPATAAGIAKTLLAPQSTGRARSGLGPVVALLVFGALIIATVLLWDQAGGFVTPNMGTPAPSL